MKEPERRNMWWILGAAAVAVLGAVLYAVLVSG
jgi:uncharacterized protein involved in exopolysaccharide biosynthesis